MAHNKRIMLGGENNSMPYKVDVTLFYPIVIKM